MPEQEKKPIAPYMAIGLSTAITGIAHRKHIKHNLANIEEAIQKKEADTFKYVDKLDLVLKNHNVLLAEDESASTAETSAPAQRIVSTPTVQQTQQGDIFRDVTVLKPNFLEKGSNLMEVLHWTRQAKNYIEAGYRDIQPKEGT